MLIFVRNVCNAANLIGAALAALNTKRLCNVSKCMWENLKIWSSGNMQLQTERAKTIGILDPNKTTPNLDADLCSIALEISDRVVIIQLDKAKLTVFIDELISYVAGMNYK